MSAPGFDEIKIEVAPDSNLSDADAYRHQCATRVLAATLQFRDESTETSSVTDPVQPLGLQRSLAIVDESMIGRSSELADKFHIKTRSGQALPLTSPNATLPMGDVGAFSHAPGLPVMVRIGTPMNSGVGPAMPTTRVTSCLNGVSLVEAVTLFRMFGFTEGEYDAKRARSERDGVVDNVKTIVHSGVKSFSNNSGSDLSAGDMIAFVPVSRIRIIDGQMFPADPIIGDDPTAWRPMPLKVLAFDFRDEYSDMLNGKVEDMERFFAPISYTHDTVDSMLRHSALTTNRPSRLSDLLERTVFKGSGGAGSTAEYSHGPRIMFMLTAVEQAIACWIEATRGGSGADARQIKTLALSEYEDAQQNDLVNWIGHWEGIPVEIAICAVTIWFGRHYNGLMSIIETQDPHNRYSRRKKAHEVAYEIAQTFDQYRNSPEYETLLALGREHYKLFLMDVVFDTVQTQTMSVSAMMTTDAPQGQQGDAQLF
jgi:hypothetical protein